MYAAVCVWLISSIYVAVCVWFDKHNRHKEARHREGPESSTDDFTNLTHRKDLTASGDPMRDNKDSKTF